MKTNSTNQLICRTPVFDIDAKLSEKWGQLKELIAESSPTFYQLIAHVNAKDIDQQDSKIKYTIWKYFNRAKFRATPFGTFAAITVIPIHQGVTLPVILRQKLETEQFTCWSLKEEALQQVMHHQNITHYLANSTYYTLAEQIRYIRHIDGKFELSAVAQLPELIVLLQACKTAKPKSELYLLMAKHFSMSRNTTAALLNQLLNIQLLSSNLTTNITGSDYFTRIGFPIENSPQNYRISKRPLIQGSYHTNSLLPLAELTEFLSRHLAPYENNLLSEFKKAFAKRYDQQAVSLAQLMDPESGISYGNMAQHSANNPLISQLKETNNEERIQTIAYGPLQRYLLNGIISNKPIQLNDFREKSLSQPSKLPNTYSILFRYYKGCPVISQAGGATATSLLGRFTFASDELTAYGQQLTAFEQQANPEVLFFDIAYQGEKKTDNVNRRKLLYPLELPILSWSETKRPLDLEDIYILLRDNEFILKSKKHGKRLIPRLSSAYNYTRSDLAIYRFLCDLQHQGLLVRMKLDLQELFPGLDRYPRLCFKQIILSGASWLVPQHLYYPANNDMLSVDRLRDWLNTEKINSSFRVGHADHTLYFDPASLVELQVFLSYCFQQGSEPVYITEALLERTDCPKNNHGKYYAAEYIVDFQHDNCLYSPAAPHYTYDTLQPYHLPGSDWLYFELYCAPTQTNHILGNAVKDFLNLQKINYKQWFFIRYSDPSPHLRLRIQLKSDTNTLQLLEVFQQAMMPLSQNGILHDLQIKTYKKEIQRYGHVGMDKIESFFYTDSCYALKVISQLNSDNELILNTLALCHLLLPNLGALETQLNYIKNLAGNFSKELNCQADQFKKINYSFNALQIGGKIELLVLVNLPKSYLKQFTKLFKVLVLQLDKEKLLADLIHMHINRLFASDQRIYEAVIYHYLLRRFQTIAAITKTLVEVESVP